MQKASRSGVNPTLKALVPASSYADTCGLSFYASPPNVEVSHQEFQDFTKDRLKLLHAINRHFGYDTRLEMMLDQKTKVISDMVETGLGLPNPRMNPETFLARKEEFLRKDSISFFVLLLAFCHTREAKEWFLRQEQRLFVLRFEGLSAEAREALIASCGLDCKKLEVPPRELETLQKQTPAAKLWTGTGHPTMESVFFEMPFDQVPPSLISGRRVVLKKGRAMIPANALTLVAARTFKERVAASLEVAFQGLNTALSDPRVGFFIKSLQEHGMQLLVAPRSVASSEVGDKLTLDNFEVLMPRSFPPCMRRLVEYQREHRKHLKHAGRLQLRPFLKDIGFGIEDSYTWWRQELSRDPTIDSGKFDKHYSYDLDHAYGKKGHLQGQNCFGCPKIIGFPAESSGQVHGCPFKQLDAMQLKQQLFRWQVPEANVMAIEKLVTNGRHYQLACIEYFKALHPGHEGEGVGNSPGDYYKESCRIHQKDSKSASPSKTPETSPAAVEENGVLRAAGA